MPTDKFDKYKRKVPTEIDAEEMIFSAALQTELAAINAVAVVTIDGATIRDGDYVRRTPTGEPGEYKYRVFPKVEFVDGDQCVLAAQVIKNSEELKCMRVASEHAS